MWTDLADQGERLLHSMSDYLAVWMHHWIGLAFARAGGIELARKWLDFLRNLREGRDSGYWSTLGRLCWRANWR